jgi:23S rRNA (pseudouridine1915-N3)-methyltransferase
MTIDLVVIGKTDLDAVTSLMEIYLKRINRYAKFSIVTIPDLRNTRNLTTNGQKKQEGDLILRQLTAGDYVVLLDDKGTEHTSARFAEWLQRRMVSGVKRLVFVIGGAYGFSPEVYARADERLSLSRMTFSHQIIRPLFAEQLYRAFTILGNEPYHHE